MNNWKTTVAGAIAAGAIAWSNAGNLDLKHVAIVVAVAVFGYLSKDA